MTKFHYAHVNEHNEIVLPARVAEELGIVPGDELRVKPNGHGIYVLSPVNALKRVYVEATNKCNLNCSTCIRNVWDVEFGCMTEETFEHILASLQDLPNKPELFFGGYGEPLSHPRILDMIQRAKELGHRISLITNGILLTERVANRLIELKLDMLWVSMDGASSECYIDVRLGDALPRIIDNLKYLQVKKYRMFGASNWAGYPKLGIAFVAMKRNIHDLNEVIRLGGRLGAVEFSISNVLAHDQALLDKNLYMRSLDMVVGQEIRPLVHMPLMDICPETMDALSNTLKNMNRLELTGSLLNQNTDQCPFVERGSVAIRWDGMVSPCLPLLYSHTHFLDDRERTSREYFVGNIHEKSLLDIWIDENYSALRKRLQDFDFSPCAFCNSCEMANENLEDCFGNTQPTCGGCLWARGLIRCP
ncbi:MAG: SPASM domain-containing protein [Anaerolineales bacterium]|nr:SPASM domain-containing protein [Anaerolineales bacterium]